MFQDPRLARMASFLASIGIEMRAGTLVPNLFPGGLIQRGWLIVDETNPRLRGVEPFPHMVRWLRPAER